MATKGKKSPPLDRDYPPRFRFLIGWRKFALVLRRFAWYSGLNYVYRKLVIPNPTPGKIRPAPSYFHGHRWHTYRVALAIVDHLIRRAASRPGYAAVLQSLRADINASHPDGALARLRTFVGLVQAERTAGSLDAPLADELAELADRLFELLEDA